MPKKFSACELVDIAIQIEKNGRDFYSALAGKSKDPSVVEIFKYLSNDENQHIADFKKMFNSVCNYEPEGAYPEEYFAYMNTLAGQYVFTEEGKGKKMAEETKSMDEGINMAMALEKDSVLFYEEMKKNVPEKSIGFVDKIIGEEKKHITKLYELKGGNA